MLLREQMGRLLLYMLLGGVGAVSGSHPIAKAEGRIVGEIFGQPVTEEAFAYHHKTVLVFGREGEADRTPAQAREEAWRNMIYLQEAKRLGLSVSKEELDAELKRLLDSQGVDRASPRYGAWVMSVLNENTASFESRFQELLLIEKLKRHDFKTEVQVTDEEAQNKYLRQNNSFECEYVRFDDEQQAQEFQKAVASDPALWKVTFDRKRSEEGQKGAAWISLMTVEAMADLWQFPEDEANRILQQPEGSFLVTRQIYGDIVLRLLQKRSVSLDEYDDQKKATYRDMMAQVKKYEALKTHLDELIKRAAIRDFDQENLKGRSTMQPTQARKDLKEKTMVRLETTQGVIGLRLFPEIAPKTCENFVTLIEKSYYDGLIFHRVIKGFMIQGGDPTGTGTGGTSIWNRPFEDEIDRATQFNRPGILAMANAGPNTNGSQFFITTQPTPWLNGKHTIFGEVVSGIEVLKAIETTQTGAGDRPVKEQKILKATVEAAAAQANSS